MTTAIQSGGMSCYTKSMANIKIEIQGQDAVAATDELFLTSGEDAGISTVGLKQIFLIYNRSRLAGAKLSRVILKCELLKKKRTCPLPLALKQIETLLHQIGEQGEDLLARYFEERELRQ